MIPSDNTPKRGRKGNNRTTSGVEGTVKGLKQRLTWIVRTTADGSQKTFANLMETYGCGVEQTTVSNWLDQKKTFTPGVRELWTIHQIRPNISIDWLLGIRPAETVDEQFIDSQIKG